MFNIGSSQKLTIFLNAYIKSQSKLRIYRLCSNVHNKGHLGSTELIIPNEDRTIKVDGQLSTEKWKDAALRSQLFKPCDLPCYGTYSKSLSVQHLLRYEPEIKSIHSEVVKLPFFRDKLKLVSSDICPAQGKSSVEENRDLKTRIVRNPAPGKVVWGFIPKEWVDGFVPKTGHSGFYTMLFTVFTYLVSKEIYVLEHEFYSGISLAIIYVYGVKTYGPDIAKALDEEIDQYEAKMTKFQEDRKKVYEKAIKEESVLQQQNEGQLLLIEAKRENVLLQLEAEYRKRQMHVYDKVKGILDYHVAIENAQKKIAHQNLQEWIIKEVEKSLTPELRQKFLAMCLADFRVLIENARKSKE